MNGVEILNAMIAVSLDGAGTLAKGADIIKDPHIKSLLAELALEREGGVTRLKDEVRSLGGTPEDRGTVVGSAHRLYTEVKLALAPDDRRAVIDEIKRSEERVREKFQELLHQDKALPPAVREIVEQHFDQVRRSCSRVNQLELDSEAPPAQTRRPQTTPPGRRTRKANGTQEHRTMTGKQRNEGEGNKTAAKEYNDATRKFVESGKVDQKADEAARAREGAERKELDRAEQAGKSHAKEEDAKLHRQAQPVKTE
jgi:uncharacterized protein (TIGR02284 family)